MTRPNILYLHTHDAGRYIQPYGYAIPTPNLQRLAEGGVLFRQAHCLNPTCSASRAALLTGTYPHQNGMLGLAHRGWCLNDYSQHLLHWLREKAGYHSALAGTQHITDFTRKDGPADWEIIGYDESVAPSHGLPGEQVARAATEWLGNAPPQPFFLSVGFGTTHRVFEPLEASPRAPAYVRPPEPLPDTPQMRIDMARYIASATRLDEQMGAVLAGLEAAGLAQNTLVICTADHGIAFPRMKCTLTDAGTGVMLILRGPGVGAGRCCDAMVTHLDLYPTLCEVLGIDAPPWLEGTSLWPLLRGRADEIHEDIFTEVNYHAAYEPQRAVRTKRFKYIRRYDGRTRPVLPNCDDGESKSLWLEYGWADRPVEPEALYDLLFDPNEACNLVDREDHGEVLAELRGRLDRWMRRTDDPLLRGLPIPPPPGARANVADGLSPEEPPLPAEEIIHRRH